MNVFEAYTKHYMDKNFKRTDLLNKLQTFFDFSIALYPASFIHITPSFFIPTVIYIDSDRTAIAFFQIMKLWKQWLKKGKRTQITIDSSSLLRIIQAN